MPSATQQSHFLSCVLRLRIPVRLNRWSFVYTYLVGNMDGEFTILVSKIIRLTTDQGPEQELGNSLPPECSST